MESWKIFRHFGVYRNKDNQYYFAAENNETWVKTVDRMTEAELHVLAELANTGLRINRETGLRFRIIRRLLRR